MENCMANWKFEKVAIIPETEKNFYWTISSRIYEEKMDNLKHIPLGNKKSPRMITIVSITYTSNEENQPTL